jgi:hypothetical protein
VDAVRPRRPGAWLLGGMAVAFLVPFVVADRLGLQRDLYLVVYVAAVLGVFVGCARDTGQSLRAMLARRRRLAVGLGILLAGLGAVAMVASLAMTAVYHAGYSDFRGSELRKPLIGDLVWSVPTLVTLNPLGAPIAHIGVHVTAIVHNYDTDLFLPPH